jgi:hypothetical protein
MSPDGWYSRERFDNFSRRHAFREKSNDSSANGIPKNAAMESSRSPFAE